MMNSTISPRAEEAITLSQGHSRETAEKYYRIQCLQESALIAATAHKDMYGVQKVPHLSSEDDAEYVPDEDDPELVGQVRWDVGFSIVFLY